MKNPLRDTLEIRIIKARRAINDHVTTCKLCKVHKVLCAVADALRLKWKVARARFKKVTHEDPSF